ncbi:hypothetical protein GH714_012443 [Hevea brasiliensis]|uniref:Uncharacterized protein n=1 Tax=Hevea brasiliensis TaxID=3981 RepID=A0A6A6NGU4_HEVBR|nr:hypothetical protein GH714_012443 [Hevea brasiliensis]
MAANNVIGSTITTARVCCLMHNEANNYDFFLWYDDELVPDSKERCVFEVIFDKTERLQGVISSKEQNVAELERSLKATEVDEGKR